MSLEERFEKIRSPKLQNQHKTAIVLAAVEDTLRDQRTDFTATGYFAALLTLLKQSIPANGVVDKDLTTSVVYLLDIVIPHTPRSLLRSKFSQLLTDLAPALTLADADAPLLRPSIGCLESLLVAQDGSAWELSLTQIGPRRATAGLLNLALDPRPKVRKRSQEAITKVLQNPPSRSGSMLLDHPAADMCAETALQSLTDSAHKSMQSKRQKKRQHEEHEPELIHSIHLVRTVASASGGWPARKIEPLCELLLNISKSSNEYLTMAAFEVFEIIFEGIKADPVSSNKLPRLLDAISQLRPSENDSQLLPPWVAVLSRGYGTSAEIEPEDTFMKLPELFDTISAFLASSSHNIRVSASECLISFVVNCIPASVILEPSIYDEKVLGKIALCGVDLLNIKYQGAWMESFNVLGSMFDTLRWRANPVLNDVVKIVGELRANHSFTGKKEADEILGKAIRAMGPEAVLSILPLNLTKPVPGQPGRAWLLPILRDYVCNTNLQHFRTELVPLSEITFQRVIDHGAKEKTMEVKIYETLVQQIWALLPGYCDLPLDLSESFDQGFAELLANLLYEQTGLRSDICRALQTLVESNKAISEIQEDDDLLLQSRISKASAQTNLAHLSGFASNILAVLFNVYSQTLPAFRGFLLNCINAYLGITPVEEIQATFQRVIAALESSITENGVQTQAEKQKQKAKSPDDKMPPPSHTLMDLVITISIYLPRESYATLFTITALLIVKDDDPQLQKKAYKLIPRLAESANGKTALQERSAELQQFLLDSSEKVSSPAKRDRLSAIATLISFLPATSLHFIPSILSEVVICCKEVNERARAIAFELLISMGEKIVSVSGTKMKNSKVAHMPDDAPDVSANLEEYITMVSAGLASSTPHIVSASITALSRIVYHFREALSPDTLAGLVQTMDLFLTSNNREIVQSDLGFVKVCVISLPLDLMKARLETLIPNLVAWSHEHKAHFKAKVKHIIERMIRRFGVDIVNRYCPEEDRKLITNIRKTKERNKRHKEEAKAAREVDKGTEQKRKSRFESEYEEAIHDSDDDTEGSDVSDNELLGKSNKRKSKTEKGGKTYIVEDEEDPLDLLDRKAFASISSTKPLKQRVAGKKQKVKTNADGKLLLGGDSDDDANEMVISTPTTVKEDKNNGVGAYVDAIRGRHAVQRGRGGRLKFSNKRDKVEDQEMEMDEDEAETVKAAIARKHDGFRGGRGGRGSGRGSRNGRGGISAGRKEFGEQRKFDAGSRFGRAKRGVMKSPRGNRKFQ